MLKFKNDKTGGTLIKTFVVWYSCSFCVFELSAVKPRSVLFRPSKRKSLSVLSSVEFKANITVSLRQFISKSLHTHTHIRANIDSCSLYDFKSTAVCSEEQSDRTPVLC